MVRVGVVLLPQERWADQRRRWQQLEHWGFDHAWTYDHLAWRSLADEPWLATVPLLAAAAAVTSRIELGTFVASPNFRHPVPFAKDVMGLDDVSGGRFVLGVGAGGTGFDASVLGAPPTPRERSRRFGEFVDLLDRLLRQPVTSHEGEFYEVHEARMRPGTIARPRVPFVVAAAGPKAMALAAQLGDGWVTYGPSFGPEDATAPGAQDRWWDGLEEQGERMDEAERAASRVRPLRRYLSLDGAPLYGLSSLDLALDGMHRAAALGFDDVVVHWPRRGGVYAGDERVLDQLAGRLDEIHALAPAGPSRDGESGRIVGG